MVKNNRTPELTWSITIGLRVTYERGAGVKRNTNLISCQNFWAQIWSHGPTLVPTSDVFISLNSPNLTFTSAPTSDLYLIVFRSEGVCHLSSISDGTIHPFIFSITYHQSSVGSDRPGRCMSDVHTWTCLRPQSLRSSESQPPGPLNSHCFQKHSHYQHTQ